MTADSGALEELPRFRAIVIEVSARPFQCCNARIRPLHLGSKLRKVAAKLGRTKIQFPPSPERR